MKKHLFRFQPQVRVEFHFVCKNGRIRHRVVKDTVIPFLRDDPNESKPNNFKVCEPISACLPCLKIGYNGLEAHMDRPTKFLTN